MENQNKRNHKTKENGNGLKFVLRSSRGNRVMAMVLVVLMLLSLIPAFAFAREDTVTAGNADTSADHPYHAGNVLREDADETDADETDAQDNENTPKEEVVYINLNGDGSVEDIYVVNIFDLDEAGTITDYGVYENVRNMTTTDAIVYEEDIVTIEASAGRLYYEGKLTDNKIPWNISIHYYIDGEEYTADQVAGMSGELEIRISIRKNTACAGSFFEGYALQASLTLDTDNAKNIQAEDATVANVGSEKQLTFTILPDTEKDLVITADVTEFEMSGISINGIRMNMDIAMEDSELEEEIRDMMDAVRELDEGAGELNDGAGELYSATGDLYSAMGELSDGVTSIEGGAERLSSGLLSLEAGNQELLAGAKATFEGLCSTAETQLNAGLRESGLPQVRLTPDTYAEVLQGLLNRMDAMAANAAAAPNAGEMMAQFSAVKGQITSLKEQLDRYAEFYNGLIAYTNGVSASAGGAVELSGALQTLSGNTETLHTAVGDLYDATGSLQEGTDELKSGTEEFVSETDGMDSKISDEMDSITSSMMGRDVETVSFVSEQNVNIESVQFVMQTEEITIPEPEPVEESEPEKLSFWDKLCNLFRRNS